MPDQVVKVGPGTVNLSICDFATSGIQEQKAAGGARPAPLPFTTIEDQCFNRAYDSKTPDFLAEKLAGMVGKLERDSEGLRNDKEREKVLGTIEAALKLDDPKLIAFCELVSQHPAEFSPKSLRHALKDFSAEAGQAKPFKDVVIELMIKNERDPFHLKQVVKHLDKSPDELIRSFNKTFSCGSEQPGRINLPIIPESLAILNCEQIRGRTKRAADRVVTQGAKSLGILYRPSHGGTASVEYLEYRMEATDKYGDTYSLRWHTSTSADHKIEPNWRITRTEEGLEYDMIIKDGKAAWLYGKKFRQADNRTKESAHIRAE